MELTQTKTIAWEDDEANRSVTYVKQARMKIDEKGLRKALTAKVFDKYTVKTLNRPALEKAMDSGEVDAVTVAKYTDIVESKPFLRFTEKEKTDAQE